MSVLLKCAACGAEVEFESLSPTAEATCPGCEVKVRYREGDEQMAIPVSMNLPQEFQHINLASVADKSSLLVGRYRKQSEDPPRPASSDAILAKALESLAQSIGHLEERLSRQERKTDGEEVEPQERDVREDPQRGPDADGRVARGNGGTSGDAAVVEGYEPADGHVVQLEPEKKTEEKFRGKSKANPLGARVLVRREAAREAHVHRRERHVQSDWDEHGAEHGESSRGFTWLMRHYPKTTIIVSMAMVGCFIVLTIMWMDEMFSAETDPTPTEAAAQITSLGELMRDDPEAATAEIVARGFLNATSVEAAAPFIYESSAIRDKLAKYYKPIATPGDYELTFKHRAQAGGGQTQFLYRVAMPDEKSRMLVVLPEGVMPKVFWEFFAEVGDISWEGFLKEQPREPVVMRVWVYPGEEYVEGYSGEEWQNYIMHDFAEKQRLLAYADRGTSEDWRIADALENEPVKFNRHSAVMALVKLTHMVELPGNEQVPGSTVVEIKDVLATSWLPERFRPKRK